MTPPVGKPEYLIKNLVHRFETPASATFGRRHNTNTGRENATPDRAAETCYLGCDARLPGYTSSGEKPCAKVLLKTSDKEVSSLKTAQRKLFLKDIFVPDQKS